MREIGPTEVHSGLTLLFDPNAPASLRCFAVLAGLEAGRIFTDNPIQPTWGAVWEATDGTLYTGGPVTSSVLRRLIGRLHSHGDVLLGYWPGDSLATRLPQAPDYVGTVLEFLDRPADLSDLAALVQRLPAGLTLRRMDAALLLRSHEYSARTHGSPDAFLARHLAVGCLQGTTLVCEASTGPSVQGVRELGVWTDAAYRGRGLATVTCAYLIQACAEVGDRTYWNCASTNHASAAVARKLGYRIEREYQLVAWLHAPA